MKRFLIFFVIFFLGCLHKVEYPAWFKNPPQDRGNVLYATGEGIDKTSAINDALTQIANKISTSISSNFFIYQGYIQNNKEINTMKSVQKQILQKINNFHFYDYKVLKIKSLSDKDYIALVEVNKAKNAKLIIEKNKILLENLRNKFKILKNPILKIKFAINTINLINKKVFPQLFIAKVLGGDSDNLIQEYQQFLVLLEKYLQSIKIAIKANKYRNILKDSLDFPIVSNSNLLIKMNVKETSVKVDEEYIYQIKVFLTINYKEIVLVSKEIVVSKYSYVNFNVSKNLALQELKIKLKEFFKKLF